MNVTISNHNHLGGISLQGESHFPRGFSPDPQVKASGQIKQTTSTILMSQGDSAFLGVRSVHPDTWRAISPVPACTPQVSRNVKPIPPGSSGLGSGQPAGPARGRRDIPQVLWSGVLALWPRSEPGSPDIQALVPSSQRARSPGTSLVRYEVPLALVSPRARINITLVMGGRATFHQARGQFSTPWHLEEASSDGWQPLKILPGCWH